MGEDFLLSNDIAKKLYNDYAKDMPIFDYHCHLIPEQIAKDIKYNNISVLENGYGISLRNLVLFGKKTYQKTTEKIDNHCSPRKVTCNTFHRYRN